MAKKMRIPSSLHLTVNFIKEGKKVIAYAPALDLSTAGSTQKEAKKRFEEIAGIFLKDIIDRGVIDRVLTELGWKKALFPNSEARWTPPQVKSVDIKIPVSI